MSLPQRTFPKSVSPGIPRLGPLRSGWKRVQIGELFQEHPRPVQVQDETQYNLVTVKRSRGGIEKRSTLFGKQIGVKSQFELKVGDFLISKRQIVHGACTMVPPQFEGSIVSNEYSVLRCTDALDLKFLSYLTHTPYFQRTCFHSSIGVHVEKMIFKLSDWFNWKIDIPSLPEQKKIADFLGAVDAKLAALREKEAALTRFKRGLMQALFSQTLRFTRKDGSNYPDWEEKRLNQISLGKLSNGVFNDPTKVGSGYRLINVKDMYSTNIIDPLTLSKIDIGENDFKKNQASWGDIFFTRSSLVKEGIAYSNVLLSYDEDITFDGHLIRLKPDLMKITPLFIYYSLSTNLLRKQLVARGKTGTMTTIGQADISSVQIPIPGIDEQKKIADALSAMDATIRAVTSQITQLTTFKKGLLQQMFV